MSSNSLPHFLQGPEPYPGDGVITHLSNRAKSGASVVSVAGLNGGTLDLQLNMDMDFAHFGDWDLYSPPCQNYLLHLADLVHYHGSLIDMCLFVGPPSSYPLMKKIGPEMEQGNYNGDTGDVTKPFDLPFEEHYEIEQIPAHMLPHEYDEETLDKIAASYAEQCGILKKLNYDMVNIHMCYRGNLPAKFISPLTNFRTDHLGGSLENRMKFPLMMLKRVREAIGKDMILEIQWSSRDTEGGYSIEDTIEFLNCAKEYVDIVQLRGEEGDMSHPTGFNPEATPFLEDSAYVKSKVDNLVITSIGGYMEPETMEHALEENMVDMFALARAWISNPDYGNMIAKGKAQDIVPCLRCNKCHGRGPDDPFISVCSVNPKIGIEHRLSDLITPVAEKKSVAIIGGGPAGMRCALDLAERGHRVNIYEATDKLGGAIKHADYVSFKWPLRDYYHYLIDHVTSNELIDVHLSTRMTPEQLEQENYDAVITAVGAQPIVPPIDGLRDAEFVFAGDAMTCADKLGERVVVIGGGEVGVEAGMHLAEHNRSVTVLEMRSELAADATKIHYRAMMRDAWEELENFSSKTGVTVTKVTSDKVFYVSGDGTEASIPYDSLVVAAGMKAKTEDALSFYGSCPAFYMIGDCKNPATIQYANRTAFAVANSI